MVGRQPALLATPLFRLVLNVASTRLILSADADTPEQAEGAGFVARRNVGLAQYVLATAQLESVLPANIRAKLIPFLEVGPPKAAESRSPEEVLDALLKSSQSIEMSLEQFNRKQAKD